ncbi:hypothetical protein ASD39_19395 [Sphingomonas sp. Root50]|nr:hypothetical protein ASD39_19395 [Sphingomonas sp. Root50]KRB94620.1 hypothetical protein ASE22_01360 [Sphingomonas sp. Root720]
METRSVIKDKMDRRVAREAIFACTSLLIASYRPERLVMFTHTADLPEAAVEKFDQLASVFEAAGYS